MATPRERSRAIAYMAICASLWSIAGILIKLIDWNAFTIAGVRSLISAGVIAVYLRAARIPFRPSRRAVVSGAALCVTSLCFVCANKLTTAANAIVLQYCAPIFIMLLSWLLFRQRFRPSDFLVVALVLLGIVLCFADQVDGGRMLGNGIAVVAGFSSAVMFVVAGNAGDEERISGILLGHLFTAACGLPTLLFLATPLSTRAVASILVLGVFQLGLPYILYSKAAAHCPPLYCCLIGAVEPLLNPVWVFLFDGEAPGLLALAGGVVVIGTITGWSIWSGRQDAAKTLEASPPNLHQRP